MQCTEKPQIHYHPLTKFFSPPPLPTSINRFLTANFWLLWQLPETTGIRIGLYLSLWYLTINVESSYVYLAIKCSVIHNWRSKELHHYIAIKAASIILPGDPSSINLTWRSEQHQSHLAIKAASISPSDQNSIISPGDQSSINLTWRLQRYQSYLAIKAASILPGDQSSINLTWRSKQHQSHLTIKAASISPGDQSSIILTWRHPCLEITGALSIQGASSLHSNQRSISRTWRSLPGDQSSVNFTWQSKKRHS